jgi:hypothetical protein
MHDEARWVAAKMKAQKSPDSEKCVGAEFWPSKPLAKAFTHNGSMTLL